LDFDAGAFGAGSRGVEALLREFAGQEWEDAQATIMENLRPTFDQVKFTRDEARSFLSEVTARTAGEIPDDIRRTLLWANPRYAQRPAQEFLDGWKCTFHMKDHPKSKGANLSFSYPASWVSDEGEHPNIVQKFVSKGRHGSEMVAIITKELPLPAGTAITETDKEDFFSPEALRDIAPGNATFLGAQSTTIDGEPAGIIEYTMAGERLGLKFVQRVWAVTLLCGDTLVQVQFGVGGPVGSETDIEQRMALFKPLFWHMANCIVLPDKWTAGQHSSHFQDDIMPAVATTMSPLQSWQPPNDGSPWIATPFIVFALGCGIALTPPLVLRYVIVRRPLSRKTSSWLAAGFSAFFLFAAIALVSEEGELPKIGPGDILMFMVSRWIMTRGYVPASMPLDKPSLPSDSSCISSGQMFFRRFLCGSG
jgi:hypothetical protein